MNGYVSKSAFARIYGCGLSYVTKLRDLNRLVLSEDGKLVNVDATLKLIDATGDPSKAGVRERWQAYREGRELDDMPANVPPVSAPATSSKAKSDGSASDYHLARTQKEQIDAQLKMIELRKLQGQIAEVEPILRAVHDTHAAARSALLQLPDRLAQMLAPETDPLKVHEILYQECVRVCEVMGREVQRLRERNTVEVES